MKKIICMFLSIFIIFGAISPICLAGKDVTDDKKTGDQPQKAEIAADVWIDLSCLTWMCQWAFDYEKAVWISDQQNPNITATTIAQDIIFAVTYMVWTVLTLVIIYCWLMYILASRWWKDTNAYRKWLVSAAIWAILVWWAYAIIRLIQYVAKW